MKRSGFLKTMFFGGAALTGLPALAEKLAPSEKLQQPVEKLPVIERAKHLSQPYVITIENKSSGDIRDIDLFGAIVHLDEKYKRPDGSILVNGAHITCPIQGVKYSDILHNSIMHPFAVGSVYLHFKKGTEVYNGIDVIQTTSYSDNRATISMPFIKYRTPYDINDKVVVITDDFCIDGWTTLRLNHLKRGDKVTVCVYPSTNISPTRNINPITSVGQKDNGKTYGHPKRFDDNEVPL
jgi:hypothetical protein